MASSKVSPDELGAMTAKALGMFGAGIMGPNQDTFGGMVGAQAADNADSAMMAATLARQKREDEEAAKKAKKKGLFSSVGSALGSILGGVLAAPTGGMSVALGAGLGGALGNAGGQAVAGGGVDVGSALQSGITSGVTAGVAPALFGKLGLDSLTKLSPAMQGLVLQQVPSILGMQRDPYGSLYGAATSSTDPYQTGGQLRLGGY
jgi:hypothetical protein